MGKIYTLDNKLMTETPEIRIGDKLYPVDNRKKTVFKIMKLAEDETISQAEQMEQCFVLALGEKGASEIEEMNMPFPAYVEAFKLMFEAVTGQKLDTPSI